MTKKPELVEALKTDYRTAELKPRQRALLDYYADIHTRRFVPSRGLECDLYLVQDERKPRIESPGTEWQIIWQGHRPSDRRERFRLYQRLGS